MHNPSNPPRSDDLDSAPTAGQYGYHGHHHVGGGGPTAGTHDVRDPVCGATFDPHTTRERVEYGQAIFYFCSAPCQSTFEANPGRYVTLSPGGLAPQDYPPSREM